MSWVKKVLFGRQLSHGSEQENPQTFEEAIPQAANVSELQQTVSAFVLSASAYADTRDNVIRTQTLNHAFCTKLSLWNVCPGGPLTPAPRRLFSVLAEVLANIIVSFSYK